MPWFHFRQSDRPSKRDAEAPLALEALEDRTLLAASAVLANGLLTITGGPGNDRITVYKDAGPNQLVLLDGGREVNRFASGAVTQINIDAAGGNNVVRITNDVQQIAVIQGGAGDNVFYAGGGPTTLQGGNGVNKLVAGSGPTVLIGGGLQNYLYGGANNNGGNAYVSGPVANLLYNVRDTDTVQAQSSDVIVRDPGPAVADQQVLTADEVGILLQRAAAASASNDAIIAVVDRGGNILGIRVESGVASNIQNDPTLLSFAVDGALAEARTGAFFANDQAPLTSRTIQELSQSTITQREVNSLPEITDPNSTVGGPGFVAPIGIKAHFPPGVMFTPQADLFEIEHTNRDSIISPGADGIKGTADDIVLSSRFNVPTQFIPPGQALTPPESYGFVRFGLPNAQARGIGTLPGGIPIFKNGQLVGGIGVFFPGKTGFASEENSSLSAGYDPTKPDRSLEAEYMAFAAVGGSSGAGASVGTLGGIAALPGFDLPFGRIDLAGITLDLFGPGGRMGINAVIGVGKTVGVGNPNDGQNIPINRAGNVFLQNGVPVPSGVLVTPHDGSEPGVRLTASDVQQIFNQGIAQSVVTQAAIRLPASSPAKFVFAVSDTQGNILGIYRQPDATVFSIDVAVAKARNVAYYANPAQLQTVDQVPGVPKGVAFTSRTFRYLADPRFPEGIDGTPAGPFSQLNDGGVNPKDGLSVGPPLPISAYQSALGYDAFHPGTNFRDPVNPANQNGVVWFPGSIPLYKMGPNGVPILVGGLGVSGDGVNQDDVATFAAAQGFLPPAYLEADQFSFNGVRLPYVKFNRNPDG